MLMAGQEAVENEVDLLDSGDNIHNVCSLILMQHITADY